ncbi:hypothetical protein [Laceyella putida]|uniref:Uncharacterized protein n=1 Tax=Laceyella putida TaxID=110101 RepID=A0ABW2RFQ0_9BACL
MVKAQDKKTSQQAEEKIEATVIWESPASTDSREPNVIPFPVQKEATYQERTIQQEESVVNIRIVSSGFGGVKGSVSFNTMQAAA